MIFRRLLLPIDLCMVVFALSAVIGIFTAYDLTMSTPIGLTIIISVALYFVTAYAGRGIVLYHPIQSPKLPGDTGIHPAHG
jgi:hypothetical protein